MQTMFHSRMRPIYIVRNALIILSGAGLLFGIYWTWRTIHLYDEIKASGRALDNFTEANLEYISLLKDVEGGVRGYLLTRDEQYLGIVREAEKTIPQVTERIKSNAEVVGADPTAVAHLLELGSTRLAHSIKLIIAQSTDIEILQGSLDEGKVLMDATRREVGALLDWAHKTSHKNHTTIDRTLAGLTQIISALGLGGILLTLLLTYAFQSEIRTRIKAERELAVSRENLALAIEGARLGVWFWDIVEDRLDWSERAKAIFGLPSDYVMTVNRWLKLIHPDDRERTQAAIQRSQTEKTPYDIEFRCVWPDGKIFWIAARGMTFFDQEGQAIRMQGVVQNINDRKISEEQLRQASSSKSEFLSRMSHELRTPLNAILGYGQLMDTSKLDDDDKDNLRHILRAGQHLLSLINEILDISRIEAGRLSVSPESLSVSRVIEESMEMVRPIAAARSISVRIERSSDKPLYVRADHQRIRQVLLNLVNNAVKFNRDGGWVKIRCSAAANASAVRLMIQDNGPGISPEHLGRLFTPFERLGADNVGVEGTGLGLVVSKRLIELMGGSIGVDSAPGRGSTFWVELPASDPPAEGSEDEDAYAPTPIIPPYLTVRKVLYIEDNPENLRLVQKIIGGESGVKLLVAVNGEDGIKIAETERPHLILLDLHLPGVGGAEVLHRLRAIPDLINIPVIILSADATPGQVRRLIEIGADEYLTKPFDVEALRRTITRLMVGGRRRS